SAAAEAPRSPSQRRNRLGTGSAPRAAPAAAVTLAPLPCGRARATTWGPAASPRPAGPFPEAASGAQIAGAGKRSARGPPVAPIRRVVGGDDRGEPVLARSLLGSHRCILTPRWRILSPPMPDIEAHITGNVWKIEVAVGDTVADGDTVVILESMKMEIPVESEE